MELALGWAPSWWHNRLRGGDVTTDQMLAVLDYLEVDPVTFIERSLQSQHLELDRPSGPSPDLVERAARRLSSTRQTAGVGKEFLDELDETVYQDPGGSIPLLEGLVDRVALEEVPKLLEIAGACFSRRFRLEEAHHASFSAVNRSSQLGDQRSLGNSLRRHVYILLYRGQCEEALALADRAAGILLRANDPVGLAKSGVEQALCLSYLGRYQEALPLFELAHKRLPSTEKRYICASHLQMANTYLSLGDYPRTLRALESAHPLNHHLARTDQPKLVWIKARVFRDRSRLDLAADLFRGVFRDLVRTRSMDAPESGRDLAQVLLLEGRGVEAVEVASRALELTEAFKDNRFAQAVLPDLLQVRREGLEMARASLGG